MPVSFMTLPWDGVAVLAIPLQAMKVANVPMKIACFIASLDTEGAYSLPRPIAVRSCLTPCSVM